LDWERYGSRAEAESGAQKLMQYRETTYTIEAHGELCRRMPGGRAGENASSAESLWLVNHGTERRHFQKESAGTG
jgi:hypothetical protein